MAKTYHDTTVEVYTKISTTEYGPGGDDFRETLQKLQVERFQVNHVVSHEDI